MQLSEWHIWWKRRGGRELRSLLMEEWDPIGVAGFPEAGDEYDSYLGPIGHMLRQGASVDEVRAYLWTVRTDSMGLDNWPRMDERERETAARVVEWYEASIRGE